MNSPETHHLETVGHRCMTYLEDLWDICRSVCGPGLRSSIKYFQGLNSSINLIEIPTGTSFPGGWVIPQEWEFDYCYIEHETGVRYADSTFTNLHVVNYSLAVDSTLSYEELVEHVHYSTEFPDSVPYYTSYYKRVWGFCMSFSEYKQLPTEGKYRVKIASRHFDGCLTLGHSVLNGSSSKEIFFHHIYVIHQWLTMN